MTKLLIILLIPSILFGNLNLYNVTYLSNGETNEIKNVIFISKDGYLFTFKSNDMNERYFYIYQGDIINIKDLKIDEFIYDYDTFNYDTFSENQNYLYNVDYLKNSNEESVENVRFIGKNTTSGLLMFRQIDGKKTYYHILPENIIRITDLQTNQVINDYYNLNKTFDEKSIGKTLDIAIISAIGFLVILFLYYNGSGPWITGT